MLTAEHSVVAIVEGCAVAFALTSQASNGGYDQLIRLATHPAAQGRGIGRQLVVDSIVYSESTGAPGLALNTQASNTVSRHLYEVLGFRVVGPGVAVLERAVSGG
jgi:ribosomal protein S18 acetylase RimI-like enzyme